MEYVHRAALQHRLEIDQHVTAADQVEPRKGSVAHHVLPRENANIAQEARDVIGCVRGGEVAAQQLRTHVGRNAFRIHAGARPFDRGVADIGGEHFDRDVDARLPHELGKRDRQRVSFFTRSSIPAPRYG